MTPFVEKCQELLAIITNPDLPDADRQDAKDQLALVIRHGWHPPTRDPKVLASGEKE